MPPPLPTFSFIALHLFTGHVLPRSTQAIVTFMVSSSNQRVLSKKQLYNLFYPMYLYFRFYFMLTCLLRNLILLNVNLLLHNFYSICGAFLSFYVIVLTLLTFFLNVNFLTV